MKMLNLDHVPLAPDAITTKLLIMPHDDGITFAVANVSRQRPCKRVAVLRSRFIPWEKGCLEQVSNRELTKIVQTGCLNLIGDQSDITHLYHRFASGVRPIDFEAVCVCLPSAWSNVETASTTLRGSRWRTFTPHVAQRLNTANLSKLTLDAQRYACIDARASYLLDDKLQLNEPEDGERFYNMTCRTEFIMAERDKCAAIAAGMGSIIRDLKDIVWQSGCSVPAHLGLDEGAVFVDIDTRTTTIHSRDGINGLPRCGSERFELYVRQRLGLLESPLTCADRDNARLFFKLGSSNRSPRPENFDFSTGVNCNSNELKEAVKAAADDFWAELKASLPEPAEGRQIVISGDSAACLSGLAVAAGSRQSGAALGWPAIEYCETDNADLSARVALRAKEMFWRAPFSGAPLGSLGLYKTKRVAGLVTTKSAKAAVFAVCIFSRYLAGRASGAVHSILAG